MPVGPSHGGRSGGGSRGGSFGGSHGGAYHGGRHSSSDSFVNGMIGGMIGVSIANRRRERFEQRYGVRPTDDEYNSMPQRTRPNGFLILSIVLAFFMLCTFMIFLSAKSNTSTYSKIISIVETDWNESYKPLIEKVKSDDFVNGADGYYKTTAEFTKICRDYYEDNPTVPAYYYDFTRNDVSYCFIVYEYEDETGHTRTGTTYTQFSKNQIQNLDGEIEIAFYSRDNEHYSINTSYNLETCEEYLRCKDALESSKSTASSSIGVLVVEAIVLALFITLYVLKMKKYYKLVSEDEEILFQKKKAEAEKATAEANAVKLRNNKYCSYCGCKIEADATQCSSCGAKLTK